MSGRIDLIAPVYARLATAAKRFGYADDWRLARPLPPDVLPRPDLDALGPFGWQPSPAPAWSLPSADGGRVSLADYRGRPVLVVFYLGYGCLHCVEQLNAFAPVAEEFERLGVSIVAVSTDAPAGLAKSVATAKGDAGYPFPLVSDDKLTAFKAYRAFDDFEQVPLHGAFLVDGRGLVRWQDIGHQPFTDTKFLLAEAKRLLGQPGERVAGK
jgi:peroxiredoxin